MSDPIGSPGWIRGTTFRSGGFLLTYPAQDVERLRDLLAVAVEQQRPVEPVIAAAGLTSRLRRSGYDAASVDGWLELVRHRCLPEEEPARSRAGREGARVPRMLRSAALPLRPGTPGGCGAPRSGTPFAPPWKA